MSCPKPTDRIEDPSAPAGKISLILQWASLAAAITLGVALAWRTITGADIGCHLTYGGHLLDTGEIVDSNMFIYTDVQPKGIDNSMDFAPSSWIDDQGRLRFPNINWASQLCLALAYRAGGPTGVCLLQAALVAVLMTLISIAMLRTAVRPWAAAIGVTIVALTVQARFMHRTELFGYVVMTAQLCILIGPRIGKYSVIGLLLLQAAFVQLHSSWMLGIFLTMCFCADRIARALWARYRKIDQPPDQRGQWKWFAGVVVAQMAMAFVSPWGWRTALLPLQMMWYLGANKLMPAGQAGVTHPWSVIKEMYPSLSPIFAWSVTSAAFTVALVLGGLAAIGTLWTRRWSYLLLLAAMAIMGMQVRRNIGPSVVILVPVAVAALWAVGAKLSLRRPPRGFTTIVSGATILACAFAVFTVVTNRFYFFQGIGPRFGPGISKVDLPIEAGEYLQTLPKGTRVFTTFGLSSNVLYFGGGETGYHEVPLLGNGWACPPRNMQLVRMIALGRKPFTPFARRYGLGAVVLRIDKLSAPLARSLLQNPDWMLAQVSARIAVFVKRSVAPGPPPSMTTAQFIARIESLDPAKPVYPLQAAARMLEHLRLLDMAIATAKRATEVDPDYLGVWDVLGVNYALRAQVRRQANDPAAVNDFRQAKRCFIEAQKRDPDSQEIANKIRQVNRDLGRIDQ
ncbi:MAG: hypothetical protein QGH60_22390 [Phycisphaerae bacterium]|jgi:hypothetical protein|nr:hypothetical protein [Phycisphaerae bacterium]